MALFTWKIFLTVISATILLIAYLYQQGENEKHRLKLVLLSLLDEEQKVSGRGVRVAVGYGACEDLFVDSDHLFSSERPPPKGQHYDFIQSKDEMLEMYAYFFTHGAAAERYVSNRTLFADMVDRAAQADNARSALGGNAPVMAGRIATEGHEVLLAAKMTNRMQRLLPPKVRVVGGNIEKDDVHLIVEYKTGDQWGQHVSPRANRFIVHSDRNNPTISSLEAFDQELEDFDPHLFVVGGLQMMDNFPFRPGTRLARLTKVRDQMAAQPSSTRVHFEMASMTDEELFGELLEYVLPYAESLGMNEQELPNLHSMLKYQNISIVSDYNPRLASVLDEMRGVYSILSQTEPGMGKRPLTRLHVHTLAYQAILTKVGSQWHSTPQAAAKASLTAHRHTCGTSEIDVTNARLIMDDSFSVSRKIGSPRQVFSAKRPISCWNEIVADDKVNICVAPVLVCTQVVQTAGAGDNISSAGLVVQV